MKSSSKEKSEKNQLSEIALLRAINDSESHQIIDKVAELLASDKSLVADSAIEKQILAFSNRQLSKKDSAYEGQEAMVSQLQFVGTLNPKQWWRRLALPSFVASGFVLTVLAFQTLWQPLFKKAPIQHVSEANIRLVEEKKIKQARIDLVTDGSDPINLVYNPSTITLAREKNRQDALSEFDESIKRPSPDRRVTDNKQFGTPNVDPTYVAKGFIDTEALTEENKGKINKEPEPLQSQNIYTGSELSKSEHPEKEIWMLRIVKLYEESKNKQATKELKSFKQVYPNYPIKEKIKPYLH